MTKSVSETELVSIMPKHDLRVRKPGGQLLNSAGEAVVWTAYWRRRELEGDIERVQAGAKTRARSATAAASANPQTDTE